MSCKMCLDYKHIEKISPELFSYELYNSGLLFLLVVALSMSESRFGYCDASRLRVRPKAGEFALMIEWWNGTKEWAHVTKGILDSIEERLNANGTH